MSVVQVDSLVVSWAHCGHTSMQDRLVYRPGRLFGDARCHVPAAVQAGADILVAHHALDDLEMLPLLLKDGPCAMPERVERHVGTTYRSGCGGVRR